MVVYTGAVSAIKSVDLIYMNTLEIFESKLGYYFKDRDLLALALVHRSYGKDNNERLEFLGDSILNLIISEILFECFPRVDEGALTRMRASLVRKETLAARAHELAIAKYLLIGGSMRKNNHDYGDSILADAFEAIIGAVYLDSDMQMVKTLLMGWFEQPLLQVSRLNLKDEKTRLQEYLQQNNLPLPNYQIIEQSGKMHAPTFKVACTVDSIASSVFAIGNSRRVAEQNAARKVLTMLEIHD